MIMILGCGPVGTAIHEALGGEEVTWACDGNHPMPASGCTGYDIRNGADVARIVRQARPGKLILAEEIASVEYCENSRLEAMEFNTRGVRFFVEAAAPLRARVVYLSSALVFDGRKPGGLYTEYDQVNPINVYGETKLMGEVAVDKAADHLTLRMGEVYGAYPGNFGSTVASALRQGQKLELARDMYFSPIHVADVAKAVRLLVAGDASGTYNLAGPERISRYEMGLRIARAFGLREDLLVPLSMEEMGLKVRMPRDVSLDISRLGAKMKVRGIDEGLEAMRQAMASGT